MDKTAILLMGPTASGKTDLAISLCKRFPCDVISVDSALIYRGMDIGSAKPNPAEQALAPHQLIDILDPAESYSAAQFRRDALEALRQPLEEGAITIVRVHGAATFPAAFTLVASMNPCPCGHHGNPQGRCRCTPMQIQRYRGRLSGPLLEEW